jgi:hypothetical protein
LNFCLLLLVPFKFKTNFGTFFCPNFLFSGVNFVLVIANLGCHLEYRYCGNYSYASSNVIIISEGITVLRGFTGSGRILPFIGDLYPGNLVPYKRNLANEGGGNYSACACLMSITLHLIDLPFCNSKGNPCLLPLKILFPVHILYFLLF